jgi:hypothetical protein
MVESVRLVMLSASVAEVIVAPFGIGPPSEANNAPNFSSACCGPGDTSTVRDAELA